MGKHQEQSVFFHSGQYPVHMGRQIVESLVNHRLQQGPAGFFHAPQRLIVVVDIDQGHHRTNIGVFQSQDLLLGDIQKAYGIKKLRQFAGIRLQNRFLGDDQPIRPTLYIHFRCKASAFFRIFDRPQKGFHPDLFLRTLQLCPEQFHEGIVPPKDSSVRLEQREGKIPVLHILHLPVGDFYGIVEDFIVQRLSESQDPDHGHHRDHHDGSEHNEPEDVLLRDKVDNGKRYGQR